jgi:tetratricopeptide (TPR) repeat protein
LNTAAARLVALREEINIVLAGSIEPDGTGYRLLLSGLDPKSGETLFDVSSDADSKDTVLNALGEISADVREELGDETLKEGEEAISDTFAAASIEVAQAYTRGKRLAHLDDHEGAVRLYRQALSVDRNFGPAHAGLALSSSRLGAAEESDVHWKSALSMMDAMTERERLRTLGAYHQSVTGNYGSAIENFKSLVDQYPADAAGHNDLAVMYFLTLNFEDARIEAKRALDIYPNSTLFGYNFALYAMYAGDFKTAATEARKVVARDPNFYKGYMPLAIAAMDSGDFVAARKAYENMSRTGARGKSLANAGIADLELYSGNFARAQQIVEAGINEDLSAGNSLAAAAKLIMLAETLLKQGKNEEAVAALDKGLDLDRGDARVVPAAVIYLLAGKTAAAATIADSLAQQPQPQLRAYGLMIEALIELEKNGQKMDAVDKLRTATELADLWLIRFHTGRSYLAAGYAVEAFADFEMVAARHGEASAIFLDETPTYRYLATLPDWLDRAQHELGTIDLSSD